MGVDFHMNYKPTVKWRKDGGEWEVDPYSLCGLLEDLPYDTDGRLSGVYEVSVEPQQSVDRSDDDPHWGYGGFNRVRSTIATAIGVDLEMMWGFKPYEITIYRKRTGKEWSASALDFNKDFESQWWNENCRQWSEIDSPLVPFLDHSDCDGELTPEQCAAVGPALRELVPNLDLDERDLKQLGLFISLCDDCAKYERDLIFC